MSYDTLGRTTALPAVSADDTAWIGKNSVVGVNALLSSGGHGGVFIAAVVVILGIGIGAATMAGELDVRGDKPESGAPSQTQLSAAAPGQSLRGDSSGHDAAANLDAALSQVAGDWGQQ